MGFLEQGASALPPVKVDFIPGTGAIDEYEAKDANNVRAALLDLRAYAQGLGREWVTTNEDIQAARVLAGSRTRVWYRTSAPTNDPADPHRVDDLWFDTSLYTQADVDAEKCAVADIGKKRYDAYRWDGDSWEPVNRQKLIIAAEIAAGAIASQHISTVGLDASIITSGVIAAQFIDTEGIVIGAANVDEVLQGIIYAARDNADAALEQLGAMASDDSLSRVERKTLMRDARAVYAEYPLYVGMAQRYDGTAAAIDTGNYDDAYGALDTHLRAAVGIVGSPGGLGFPTDYGTVEASATTWVNVGPADPIPVDGATLRRVFEVYYLQRATLLNDIAAASKVVTDTLGGQIQDAQDDLNVALPKLVDLASDSKLTPGEKGAVMKEAREVEFEQASLLAQAARYDGTASPVPTATKNAYIAAYNDLHAYCVAAQPTGLGMPSGFANDKSAADGWAATQTTLDVSGPTLRGKFEAYFTSRRDLLDAVWVASKALSDTKVTASTLAPYWTDLATAKAQAQTATDTLGRISSDGWITKGEKPAILLEWNAATSDYNSTVAAAQAAGVVGTWSWDNFSNAYSNLNWYLSSRSPAITDKGSDTAVVPSEWSAYWDSFYAARADVLATIFNAKVAAGDVNRNVTSISGGVITTGYVNAARIDTDILKTSNYAEDANGYATAGAKLDRNGTSIKTHANGLRVGSKLLSETWLNQGRMLAAKIARNSGGAVSYYGQIGGLAASIIGANYIQFSTGLTPGLAAVAVGGGLHEYGWPIVIDPTNNAVVDSAGRVTVFFRAYNGSDLVSGDTGLLSRSWVLSVQIAVAGSSFS